MNGVYLIMENIRLKIISQGKHAHSEYGKKFVKLVKVKGYQQLRKGCIQINGYSLISDCELQEV